MKEKETRGEVKWKEGEERRRRDRPDERKTREGGVEAKKCKRWTRTLK